MNCIPYIICTARPDYKRPYLDKIYQVASSEEEMIKTSLANLKDLILERLDDNVTIKTIEDATDVVDHFFKTYWDDGYMGNNIWSVDYFYKNNWDIFIPSKKEVAEFIMKGGDNEEDTEDDNEEDSEDDNEEDSEDEEVENIN